MYCISNVMTPGIVRSLPKELLFGSSFLQMQERLEKSQEELIEMQVR